MIKKIKSLFKEQCPYCKQNLVPEQNFYSTSRKCPDLHYKIETYSWIETEIEHHLIKNQSEIVKPSKIAI